MTTTDGTTNHPHPPKNPPPPRIIEKILMLLILIALVYIIVLLRSSTESKNQYYYKFIPKQNFDSTATDGSTGKKHLPHFNSDTIIVYSLTATDTTSNPKKKKDPTQ